MNTVRHCDNDEDISFDESTNSDNWWHSCTCASASTVQVVSWFSTLLKLLSYNTSAALQVRPNQQIYSRTSEKQPPLRFNGHFPGRPGLASTGISPFCIWGNFCRLPVTQLTAQSTEQNTFILLVDLTRKKNMQYHC